MWVQPSGDAVLRPYTPACPSSRSDAVTGRSPAGSSPPVEAAGVRCPGGPCWPCVCGSPLEQGLQTLLLCPKGICPGQALAEVSLCKALTSNLPG